MWMGSVKNSRNSRSVNHGFLWLESDKVWPTQRFEQVTGYLDDVNDDLTSKNPLPPGNEVGPEDIKN